jgi:hypothetical protein
LFGTIQDLLSTSEFLYFRKIATAAYKFEHFLDLCFGFFSTHGRRRTPAAAAVAMSFVVAAASCPASVAEAEVGSNGLGPSRTPAAAAVVVFVALCRAASPTQRAVAAAVTSSLFLSISVD